MPNTNERDALIAALKFHPSASHVNPDFRDLFNKTLDQHADALAATAPNAGREAVPGDSMNKYRLTWQEAEEICVRDEVDEALREFVHDSTGDNAIGLARCIVETWLRHPSPQAPAAEPAAPAQQAGVPLPLAPSEHPGPSLFLDWVSRWFGPDADEDHITRALADLPPKAALPASEADMRAVCEALGFDPTNHHNAAKCPYCRPADATRAQPQADAAEPVAWRPSIGTASMYAQQRRLAVTKDWMIGWNACLDAIDVAIAAQAPGARGEQA